MLIMILFGGSLVGIFYFLPGLIIYLVNKLAPSITFGFYSSSIIALLLAFYNIFIFLIIQSNNMGGKKKAAAKKGGKEGDEEDKSFENFVKFYKKRCTQELMCE